MPDQGKAGIQVLDMPLLDTREDRDLAIGRRQGHVTAVQAGMPLPQIIYMSLPISFPT